MTRLTFVETCLGLIRYLSESTFKRYFGIVQMFDQKSPEAPVSPQASSNK